MYSALSIANKYIDLSVKTKIPISNMKLQKLVYMANGISLAKNNGSLITDEIEVWPYGPVIRSVYNAYKIFGNSTISQKLFLQLDNNEELDPKSLKAFNDAWYIAKDVNAIKLSNWTHNSDSPWTRAKEEGFRAIPDEYMRDYFKKFLDI